MIACPCCRATNDAGPACRRCKADLSLLFAVAGRRAALLAAARTQLAGGAAAAALGTLAEAEAVRGGADVHRLRAAAQLLNRDFTAALAWYSAGRGERSEASGLRQRAGAPPTTGDPTG